MHIGYDQPFLNHIFLNWTTIGKNTWRKGDLYACRESWTTLDSFHFFADTRPWERQLSCGERADRVCVNGSTQAVGHECCLPGEPIHPKAPRPAARTEAIRRCGQTLAALFDQWWTAFNQLPQAIRRMCLSRFPKTKPNGDANATDGLAARASVT